MKTKFLICPVRNCDAQTQEIINKYIEDPEVYYPARDTNQIDDTGLRICEDNRTAIANAKEILFIWDGKSQGSLFDLGMAFAMNKPIKVLSVPPKTDGKSFQNMVLEYSKSNSTQAKVKEPKMTECLEKPGIPLDEFWEKDDGESMDGMIRIERFIRSRGTDSAQIWGAWYDIKQILKSIRTLTAEERAQQLFHGKGKDVPKLAMGYIKHLSNKYGGCSEMFLTGAAHYAQVIEGLICTDDLYKINDEGKDWFEKNK